MKKTLLLLLVSILVLSGIGYGLTRLLSPGSNNSTTITPVPSSTAPTPTGIATTTPFPTVIATPDYKNTTIEVEGIPVQLINGESEVASAPGSASKIITRYFGNEAFGDLNGDSRDDTAILLTQNSGGSGTFFYVVVALRTSSGCLGTNAVLLGDRIAPQTTSIEDGMLVVNYADRKPDESFATQPSVGVTKYLKIVDGKLVEENILSQITNRKWVWVNTLMNNDTVTSPKKMDAFSITFNEDGSVTGTTDCNNFFGQYLVDGNKLSFGQFGSTMMACEGSQETEFLKNLGEIESYFINNTDNTLVLLIKYDSGSMIFK